MSKLQPSKLGKRNRGEEEVITSDISPSLLKTDIVTSDDDEVMVSTGNHSTISIESIEGFHLSLVNHNNCVLWKVICNIPYEELTFTHLMSMQVLKF